MWCTVNTPWQQLKKVREKKRLFPQKIYMQIVLLPRAYLSICLFAQVTTTRFVTVSILSTGS